MVEIGTDIATKRKNMVESQVRPSDVTDRRITAAMQTISREAFVPEALKELAYIDDALSVAEGRSLMAPRTFARLLQLADISETDKVLIVGGLSGYSTMVIARLAGQVVTLESKAEFSAATKAAIEANGVAMATAVSGPLADGWAQGAPYDVIFVEGGIAREPEALIGQLSEHGRLVCIDRSSGVGRATLMQRITESAGRGVSQRAVFDVEAAELPGFERPKAFVF